MDTRRTPLRGVPTNAGARQFITFVVIAALWGVIAFASYHGWVHGTDHRDFYPRWAGAQQVLFEGRDLYSAETTRAMQLMLYGRERKEDEDPQAFAYPAILVPLLLPFWFIQDVEIATALWQSTSILLLSATLIAVRRAMPQPKFSGWWIAVALFTPYVIIMIYNAQITAIPFAAVAFAYVGWETNRDWLGGAALVAGFIKPELLIIPSGMFLLLALFHHRWQFIGGFAAAGAILFAASVVIAGWWIPGWVDAIIRYGDYAQISWALVTFEKAHSLGFAALMALLVAMLFFIFRKPRTTFSISLSRYDSFLVTAGGVALGMILLPQTLIWGLTMLSLPLAMSFRGRARAFAILAWIGAWALQIMAVMFGASIPEAWKIQNALMPLFVLIAVAAASRETTQPVP